MQTDVFAQRYGLVALHASIGLVWRLLQPGAAVPFAQLDCYVTEKMRPHRLLVTLAAATAAHIALARYSSRPCLPPSNSG